MQETRQAAPGQKGDPMRLAMQAAAGAVAATIPCPLVMLCAVRGGPAPARPCPLPGLQLAPWQRLPCLPCCPHTSLLTSKCNLQLTAERAHQRGLDRCLWAHSSGACTPCRLRRRAASAWRRPCSCSETRLPGCRTPASATHATLAPGSAALGPRPRRSPRSCRRACGGRCPAWLVAPAA